MLMLTMGGLGKSCPNVKFDHKRTIKEQRRGEDMKGSCIPKGMATCIP